jgi:hypothetical protein
MARGSLAWFAQFGRCPTGRASSLAEAKKGVPASLGDAGSSLERCPTPRTEPYSPFVDVLNVELRVALRVSPPFASGRRHRPDVRRRPLRITLG